MKYSAQIIALFFTLILLSFGCEKNIVQKDNSINKENILQQAKISACGCQGPTTQRIYDKRGTVEIISPELVRITLKDSLVSVIAPCNANSFSLVNGQEVIVSGDLKSTCPNERRIGAPFVIRQIRPIREVISVRQVLGKAFALKVGETATIRDGSNGVNVRLTFGKVVEDNRCPVDVNCIVAGRAVVEVLFSTLQGRSTILLSTDASTIAPVSSEVDTLGYKISLINVTPAPLSTRPIQNGDYKATFMITKSGSEACIDSSKINNDILCTALYDPVCGCNNITYGNACEAGRAGVTSWTKGECNGNGTIK